MASPPRLGLAAARRKHAATGQGVDWAVLDTGIAADHPHFRTHHTIAAQWDCTVVGPPPPCAPDIHGHGTHVAGIIAGAAPRSLQVVSKRSGTPHRRRPVGVAPLARLHIYQVLDDHGQGQDAYVIKALDHITELHERAGRLIIQGINLSLGGPFDPASFGCGHSPVCRELRRLWQQGVLICVAAGNEGFVQVRTATGDVGTNQDLSLSDPANLQQSIAVGSVHAARPKFYGVSYFSSRGPTADGRAKPDVVAPGEDIWSARRDFREEGEVLSDHYVAQSGTSAACPHVSGLLAAFLSARPRFRGEPERVKRLLLRHCSDLGRDRYAQGHGLPNLGRMLAATQM